MFKNKTYKGIHYSKFVASFVRAGGMLNWDFREWLKTLEFDGEPIPKDIISEIYVYGVSGHLGLEILAKKFLRK